MNKELKETPSKMRHLKAAASCRAVPKFNAQAELDPRMLGQLLDKVPRSFFNDVLPLIDGLATDDIQRLVINDNCAPLKIVRRLGCFPLSMTVHTTDKKILARDYAMRINALGGVNDRLEWSSQYSILWPTCGHFVLLPPIPDKCDPKDHQYEKITFMGRYGDLRLADTRIKGTYIVDFNRTFATSFDF